MFHVIVLFDVSFAMLLDYLRKFEAKGVVELRPMPSFGVKEKSIIKR